MRADAISAGSPSAPLSGRWRVALAGLFLFVFSVVALSGPGRLDIVDGETRYEVARSLVDHGDHIIRNPDVWFGVFPGRNGELYTTYRFPHSAAGVGAIVAADLSGPVSEGRRHFFFVLIGAVACGVLAVTYAAWFRHLGLAPKTALFWAAAGIFCTPSWYYGTSTFDDILGSAAIVLALAVGFMSREHRPLLGAAVAGLVLGIAFNLKEPLGIFVLPVWAAAYTKQLPLREQWQRLGLVASGLVLGIVAYKWYDLYKFPPGTMEANAELLKLYIPVWPGNPIMAILALTASPAASFLVYSPTVLLGIRGVRADRALNSAIRSAVVVAITGFVLFIVSISFFKGDPAWGPRYLTPVYAALWMVAPTGAGLLRKGFVVTLLVVGLLTQLLALSVDPHRLYIERSVSSGFGAYFPQLYFHPALSHILNRPREIATIARISRRSDTFTPSVSATSALPIIDYVERGPAAVQKYHVLSSFRPWWSSQRYLTENERPIEHRSTLMLLCIGITVGGVLQLIGIKSRFSRNELDQ